MWISCDSSGASFWPIDKIQCICYIRSRFYGLWTIDYGELNVHRYIQHSNCDEFPIYSHWLDGKLSYSFGQSEILNRKSNIRTRGPSQKLHTIANESCLLSYFVCGWLSFVAVVCFVWLLLSLMLSLSILLVVVVVIFVLLMLVSLLHWITPLLQWSASFCRIWKIKKKRN